MKANESGRCEHWDGLPIRENFPDLVVATVDGTPVRLSDLGTVTDGTKEVRTLARLNGKPAVVLEVQRQSGENTVAVIDGIKERLPRCARFAPGRCQCHGHSGPVALHPRSVARDRTAFGHRQHSGLFDGVAVHAVVAVDRDRRGGDSGIDHRHLRVHALVRFYPEQRHDAGLGVDGRRRDRRCDRGAGKRVSLHRRKGHGPGRSGDRRHQGNRFGRVGDHDLVGDRVPAGFVSVQRDRANAVSVRRDGDGRDSDFDADQFLVDADDVQQVVAAAATSGSASNAQVAPRLLSAGLKGRICGCWKSR